MAMEAISSVSPSRAADPDPYAGRKSPPRGPRCTPCGCGSIPSPAGPSASSILPHGGGVSPEQTQQYRVLDSGAS